MTVLRTDIGILLATEAGEDWHGEADRKYWLALADVVIDLVSTHLREYGGLTEPVAELLDAEAELSRLKDGP